MLEMVWRRHIITFIFVIKKTECPHPMAVKPEWGELKDGIFKIFHCYFQIFAIVKKIVTNIDYFINIWQVARKLSCGDIPGRGLGHMQYLADVFCDITSFDTDGGSPNP